MLRRRANIAPFNVAEWLPKQLSVAQFVIARAVIEPMTNGFTGMVGGCRTAHAIDLQAIDLEGRVGREGTSVGVEWDSKRP